MNEALVSVVIPCYLDSNTLTLAIESVYRQTYEKIELIVVNDASPETIAIERVIEKFPSIIYVRNEINLGLAATRNVGIRVAKGSLVAFLDADDEYHPRKIEAQVNFVDENTAVTCDVAEFLSQGPVPRVVDLKDGTQIERVNDLVKLSFMNYLTGASILAPRELLLKFDGFDDTLRSCEDYDLWLRLLQQGVKVIRIKLPLYFYRFNPEGLSKKVNAISFWEIEVVRRNIERNKNRLNFLFLKYAIWLVWLFRHLVRASKAGNLELREVTLKNASHNSSSTFIYMLIRLIDYLKIPQIFLKIVKL